MNYESVDKDGKSLIEKLKKKDREKFRIASLKPI